MIIMINNKNEREQKKNEAISMREAGDLENALNLFEEIEKWDEKNGNPTGQIDVLGHIRITYDRLGDQADKLEEKKKMYEKEREALEKALDIVEDSDVGRKAILQVHLASSKFSLAVLKEDLEKKNDLLDALEIINKAIENLPGTIAHKAWPLNIQAKILFELDREEEGFEAVTLGEKCIFQGYNDQIEASDNAELEIKVWLSGLYLTLAKYFSSKKENILAELYAGVVSKMPDPNNLLGERKKEAERILEKL